MIGLPTETDEDIEAIPDLAARLLARLRVPSPQGEPFGRLTLSISSFVPKPWTPFQWAAFDPVQPARGASSAPSRPASAAFTTCASSTRTRARRSSRRSSRAGIAGSRTSWRRRRAGTATGARALREWAGDPDFYTHRERPLDETLPWDHLDVGVRKTGLLREHQRAGLSPETAPAG